MATEDRARLVLWDIDRTLIESRGVGRMVYERVFPLVTGRPLDDLATVHGRTEPDILHDTLRMHGLEPTRPLIDRLAGALVEGYRAAAGDLADRGRVLPGVWRALDAVAAEAGTHQGVLTGNLSGVARVKLATFGLDHYLDPAVGAYGDDDRDRTALVSIARARAERRLGTPIAADRVVLVGDTPRDVHAALAAGARVVAVASGEYSAADLVAAGATSVLDTLADTARFRRALGL